METPVYLPSFENTNIENYLKKREFSSLNYYSELISCF
jgi:hypothetical protein